MPTRVERIREVINRRDPEGLLEMGAPEDEYTPEVKSFAQLLQDGVLITPEVVTDVWERWFGPGSGYIAGASKSELSTFAAELMRCS